MTVKTEKALEVNEEINGKHNIDLKDLVDQESKKNYKKIKCMRCDSYILQPMSCSYQCFENSVEIPSMMRKKDLAGNIKIESEQLSEFWFVSEMFTFENVGFTNTVDGKKYLICADCEIGPIGFQIMADQGNPEKFFVCLNRVKYV